MCIGVPGQVLAVGEDIHQLAQVEVTLFLPRRC